MKKICEICGKPYQYQLKIKYIDGKRYCYHDNEFVASKYEAVDRRTKADREFYAKDILQPFKKDGTTNENFKKVYGEKAIDNFKERKVEVNSL